MKDYEKYDEVIVSKFDDDSENEDIVHEEKAKYGTADPNVPSSTIPCGGCGAHLHCQVFNHLSLLSTLLNLYVLLTLFVYVDHIVYSIWVYYKLNLVFTTN